MTFCAVHKLVIFGLLGIFLAPAWAQRAPNGSVGTIDFRYPDYIVSPRVECPFEGVFPHPRDCRWYYRCYDTFGFGFFWRAYFECEPGTAFSDTLDQCVFQGDGAGCLVEDAITSSCRNELLDCRMEDICAPSIIGTSFIYRTEVCRRAQRICSGFPNSVLCDGRQLYDASNNKCIEEGALCQPTTPRPESDFPQTCQDELLSCVDVTLCPKGQTPQTRRFCDVQQYCYHQDGRGSISNKCGTDFTFDVYANKCVDIREISKQQICEGSPPNPTTPKCVVKSESCAVYDSCETREKFLGCISTYMCVAATPRSRVCPDGAVFAPKKNKCIYLAAARLLDGQPPGGIESPCVFTNVEATPLPPSLLEPSTSPEFPALPPGFDDVDQYIVQFGCSSPGEIPTAPQHGNLQCSNYTRCLPNSEIRSYNLCQRFFVCDSDNELTLDACAPNYYFDFGLKNCVNINQLPGLDCLDPGFSPSTPLPSTTQDSNGGVSISDSLESTPSVTTPPATSPTPVTEITSDGFPTEDSTMQSELSSTPEVTTTPGTPDPESTTVKNETLIVSDEIRVTCTKPGEYAHMNDAARRKYCKSYAICDDIGSYLGMESRCSEFFDCFPRRGKVVPVQAKCSSGDEVFFPDAVPSGCAVPITKTCGSFFNYWSSQRNNFVRVENTPGNLEQISAIEDQKAKTQSSIYAPQINPSQNLGFPIRTQQHNVGIQQSPNIWNFGPQTQVPTNSVQRYQNLKAPAFGGQSYNPMNLQAPQPQQFGVMAQKYEQNPQRNYVGNSMQNPAVPQTFWQANQIHQSGYPQAHLQQRNSPSPFAVFSDKKSNTLDFLNSRTVASPQAQPPAYTNANNVNQNEVSFRTAGGQQQLGDFRHHSNPGIPNQVLTSSQSVRPEDYASGQVIRSDQSFINRISDVTEQQGQPLSNFQQPPPFLGPLQSPQNQGHLFNFL